MKPIADSLDHLQGDKNCYMGDLIPTLLRTKEKLNMIINKQLTYCTPLCQGLLKSLQSRFGDYLTLDESVSDYVLALVTHPFFKLRWVPEYKPKIRQLFFGKNQARNCTFLCGYCSFGILFMHVCCVF